MCNRNNYDFGREILIDDAEGKLPERVFLEISEISRPAMGSFSNSVDRLFEDVLKVDGCDGTAVPIPAK